MATVSTTIQSVSLLTRSDLASGTYPIADQASQNPLSFKVNYVINSVNETSFPAQSDKLFVTNGVNTNNLAKTLNFNTTFTITGVQWVFSMPNKFTPVTYNPDPNTQNYMFGLNTAAYTFVAGESLGTLYAIVTFSNGQVITTPTRDLISYGNYGASTITVSRSIYTSAGGTVSSTEYSKNGGAWTSMGGSITISPTDQMSYRALMGGSGVTVWYREISVNGNLTSSATRNTVTLTTPSYTIGSSYTVGFSCYPNSL